MTETAAPPGDEAATQPFVYTVKGRRPFPAEMLLHDGSAPLGPADGEKIAALSDGAAGGDGEETEITLAGPSRPDTARWEIFGWRVPGDAAYAALSETERRDARAAALREGHAARLAAAHGTTPPREDGA